MARMIPERCMTDNSGERLVYEALSSLPDDYTVVHSLFLGSIDAEHKLINEGDFAVLHPRKGIIFIEVKGGDIRFAGGMLQYQNGVVSNKNPYQQALEMKYKFEKRLQELIDSDPCFNEFSFSHCLMIVAAWFPGTKRENLLNSKLPLYGDMNITFTAESLLDATAAVEALFEYGNYRNIRHYLSDEQAKAIVENILAPKGELTQYEMSTEHEIKKAKLMEAQGVILKILHKQRCAFICGEAGSGKTWIALRWAEQCALRQETVLFLCYNRKLHDYLSANHKHSHISYYTIGRFAVEHSLSESDTTDYELLADMLRAQIGTNGFPYKHVIIDEGQDFGMEEIENAHILELLREVALSEPNNGTFYVFYDENQYVHERGGIPRMLREAKEPFVLPYNCRNTTAIAKTVAKALGKSVDQEVLDRNWQGERPKMFFVDPSPAGQGLPDEAKRILDESIRCFVAQGYKDIKIITCSTLTKSPYSDLCRQDVSQEYGFTYTDMYYDCRVDGETVSCQLLTCRQYKGMDAQAVVLVDVDAEAFLRRNPASSADDKGHPTYRRMPLFYVGASRACFALHIICSMADIDCNELLDAWKVMGNMPEVGRKERQTWGVRAALAKALEADVGQL